MEVFSKFKRMGETTLKEGLKKGVEGLKEGKSFSEALKGGFETAKETGFKELDKFLSPENQQKIAENSEKLDNIQENIEFEPQTIQDNPKETVNEFKEIDNNLSDVSKELHSKSELTEIKEGLHEFNEILEQLKEVQDKLKELGIDVNSELLSMLMSGEGSEMENEVGEGE